MENKKIKTLWVDVETTGLDFEKDTIIELAAVCPDTGDEFHMYCLPKLKPNNWDIIEALTGISWEFLKENGRTEIMLMLSFVKFLDFLVNKYEKMDKMIFAGYRTEFDNHFLRELFKRQDNKYFNSYFFNLLLDVGTSIAEALIAGKIPLLLDNYQLSTVCDAFQIKFKKHSAIEDIKATVELYKELKATGIKKKKNAANKNKK